MPSQLTCLKVFIASPGGLAEERRAFRDVIEEYNQSDAIPRGVLFQPVGWEDSLGGVGRAQSIINEKVQDSDYFVLVLWDRWGSPTDVVPSKFSSGTEEEFSVASECYSDPFHQLCQIVTMFKAVEARHLSDPGPQLKAVLEFKQLLEDGKEHFFHTFDVVENFKTYIRKYLAAWLRDQETGEKTGVEIPDHPTPKIDGLSSSNLGGLHYLEDSKHASDQTTNLAWTLAREGRTTEAEVEFAKIVIGGQRPLDLLDYGKFLSQVGRVDQAIVMIERSVELCLDQQNDSTLASSYLYLSNVLGRRGNLVESEEMIHKSLEIFEKLNAPDGLAAAYGNLGNVLLSRGDLDAAKGMYERALTINLSLNRQEGIATSYGNLGNILFEREDFVGAEEFFRKSLQMMLESDLLEDTAGTYGNLGNALMGQDKVIAAEEMYRKALDIGERLGLLEVSAIQYGNLASILYGREEWPGAEELLRKSLDINLRLGRLEGLAIQYGNLGNILIYQENEVDAEDMFRKSLEAALRLKSTPLIERAASELQKIDDNRSSEQ